MTEKTIKVSTLGKDGQSSNVPIYEDESVTYAALLKRAGLSYSDDTKIMSDEGIVAPDQIAKVSTIDTVVVSAPKIDGGRGRE